MDGILAHNIINHKAFPESISVKIQSIANRIVYIDLPMINWLKQILLPIRGRKSLLPFSLLQITDRSWDKASMSGTTGSNNASSIYVTAIVRLGGIDCSVVPTGWPLVQ